MVRYSKEQKLIVLQVEDDRADILLMREALRESPYKIDLFAVSDGMEALDYLRRKGQFSTAPRPNLIVLDLNMPRKDGRELLHEIKTDPALKDIPVVILTTSAAKRDIERSYELGCSCFFTKPADLDEYIILIEGIVKFWATTARVPK